MDGLQALARHVAAVNAVVTGQGTEALAAELADDCTMTFTGIPVGPFEGRDTILAAYQSNPPDDTIVILDAAFPPTGAQATYAWSKTPDHPAGRLHLTLEADLITTWTVEYWSD